MKFLCTCQSSCSAIRLLCYSRGMAVLTDAVCFYPIVTTDLPINHAADCPCCYCCVPLILSLLLLLLIVYYRCCVQEKHLRHLRTCAEIGSGGRGPGGITFRGSTQKSSPLLQYLPTNLHVQEMRVRDLPGVVGGPDDSVPALGVVAVEHMLRQWVPLLRDGDTVDGDEHDALSEGDEGDEEVVGAHGGVQRGGGGGGGGSGVGAPRGVISWVLSQCMDMSDKVAVKANVEHEVAEMGFRPDMMDHFAASEVGGRK